MAACSFKAIVAGPCSYDRRDQSKSVNEVLLLSGVKDIERHKSLWSLTGVTGEQELIVLRAGIFTTQQDVSDLTICPFYRSELGTGWRKNSNTCRAPNEIAHHCQGKGNTKSVKRDRCVFSLHRLYPLPVKEFDFLPDEGVLPVLYLAEIPTITPMYKCCCARCASV